MNKTIFDMDKNADEFILSLNKISIYLLGDGNLKIQKRLSYLLLYFCFSVPAYTESIHIRSEQAYIKEGYYYLDKTLDMRLTKEVYRALEHGISIEIHTQFDLSINRRWFWDKKITYLLLAHEIKYQPLTKDYLVTNLNTRIQQTYNSTHAVFNHITSIKKIALFNTALLQHNKSYTARIRVYIDLESLPSPLQAQAYFSPDWDISSEWYTWEITQ